MFFSQCLIYLKNKFKFQQHAHLLDPGLCVAGRFECKIGEDPKKERKSNEESMKENRF